MVEGEWVRLATVLGVALGIAALLFAVAHRMRRAAEGRLKTVLEALIASPRPYGDARSHLEHAQIEIGPEGPRMRFEWRQQRGLLMFSGPVTPERQRIAPRSFGGFEDDGSARTELMFLVQAVRTARIEPRASSVGGPWHADARRHIDALDRLGHDQGIGIAASSEGFFLIKTGWLGISLESGTLDSFLDEACALVALHLEGRLFDENATQSVATPPPS